MRYPSEGGSYELYCENMLKRQKTVVAIPSWVIFPTLLVVH
jgi:3-oxosteroid 1-dehydrogenase